MIDVSEVVTDPDFAQTFSVSRSIGEFAEGGWVEATPVILTLYGPVVSASQEDLQQVPEGDRVVGAKAFYSTEKLYRTHKESGPQSSGTSDRITWQGEEYRISAVFPFEDYGYWKAIAVRTKGA